MNLYLIDGHSYFYRAFHAIKDLSNSKGFPTNALYGFTTMIFKLLREKKPDAIAIVLDSPEPTERHKIYQQYKAQRPETPDDLAAQIPFMKKIIRAFNIASFEIPGYEADDILCTMAKKAAAEGVEVYIMSGDKDMMQAVGNSIRIYDPMKDTIMDDVAVIERFGVPPQRVAEVMALTGDAIDNIPGVKGIGEKTAKELIASVGSLEELLEHPDKIRNDRTRKMVVENIDMIKLSKTLATIDTDLPVEVIMKDLITKEPDWLTLQQMFSEFELKSLLKLIPAEGHKPRASYFTITNSGELMNFLGLK
jgi:DNA polymerase-1